ncbi:hypothetical protein ACFW89_36375, partial [Streptomyces albidoflavus]
MRQIRQRRMGALALAAALAAGGITYAGFHTGSSGEAAHPPADGESSGNKPKTQPISHASAVSLARKTGKPVEVTQLRT